MDQQQEDNRYRSRKLRLAVGAMIVATAFVPLGYLTGPEWAKFMAMALGIYGLANVGDTWAERK